MRERRILNFNGRSPIEIRIVEGNKSLNLQKQENGQWQFLRKNEQGEFTPEKADQPLLDFIVEFLDRTQVMEFVLDAPTQEDLVRFGLSSPMMEITLSNPGEQTLLIGSLAGEDGLYAQKKGELFVYKITDSLLDWITADALFYRDRILQRLPSGIQIQSITWGEVDSASPPVQWQFNGDSTPINETETALRNRTVELLREMEVERYLSENFQTEIRNNQWKDKLSITWSLRGGADTSKVNRSFYFSSLSNSGIQYGGSPELDVTFILTPEWIQLLEALQDHYRPAKPVLGPPPGEQTPDPLVEGSKTDVPSLPPAAPPESSESTESP